jgi:hypothetical protein
MSYGEGTMLHRRRIVSHAGELHKPGVAIRDGDGIDDILHTRFIETFEHVMLE